MQVKVVSVFRVTRLLEFAAFFATTSLFAIGGALTILRSPEELLSVLATLPFGRKTAQPLEHSSL